MGPTNKLNLQKKIKKNKKIELKNSSWKIKCMERLKSNGHNFWKNLKN